jgi:signal transduction histidine kinase
LNEVVKNGLGVFADRLTGIDLRVELAPNLPPVEVDPEQFKRVIVNLVDNAAEAMRDSLTFSAVFFNQGARYRPGTCHCESHPIRTSCADSRGR